MTVNQAPQQTTTVPGSSLYSLLLALFDRILFGNREPIWKQSLRSMIWSAISTGGISMFEWLAQGVRYNHGDQNLRFVEDGTIFIQDTKFVTILGRLNLITEVKYGTGIKSMLRRIFDMAWVGLGISGDAYEVAISNLGDPVGFRDFMGRSKDGITDSEAKTGRWYAFRRRFSAVLGFIWIFWLVQFLYAIYWDGAKTLPLVLAMVIIVAGLIDIFRVRLMRLPRTLFSYRRTKVAATLVVMVVGVIVGIIEISTGFVPNHLNWSIDFVIKLVALTILFGT